MRGADGADPEEPTPQASNVPEGVSGEARQKAPAQKKHAKLPSTWQGPYTIVRMSEDGANADSKHVGEGTVLKQQMVN